MFFEFRCLRYKQDRQNVVGHNKEGLVIVFFMFIILKRSVMQRIEITYRSTNIEPTLFLILFFRLIGIYVSEKFFDYGVNEELLILNKFPEIRELYRENEGLNLSAPDRQFFVIENNGDFHEFVRRYVRTNIDLKKCVFIDVSGDFEIDYPIDLIDNSYYIKYGDEKQLLYNIIDVMPMDKQEQKLLKKVAKKYCKQEMWKVHLKGKYFYPADTKEHFIDVLSKYKVMINALNDSVEEHGIEYEGEKGRYIQYAICNLMYEADLYCVKNEWLELYNPKSIIKSLVSLLQKQEAYKTFVENIQLLCTQIYDDLLKEPNIAYQNYLTLYRKTNSSFVYLKMADYWRFFGQRINKAIQYYIMSAASFPEYYQAWFHLGCCYVQTGDYTRALDAFWNVKYILKRRQRAAVLRPMEVIYLYKSYCCSGYIQYHYFREIDKAILEDVTAECIWDEIEQSHFYKIMDDSEHYMKQIIKKQLHIGKLYRVIYKLANQVGDVSLAEEYHKKIRFMLQSNMSKGF